MPVGELWLTAWNMHYWPDAPTCEVAGKSTALRHQGFEVDCFVTAQWMQGLQRKQSLITSSPKVF